MNIIHYHSKLEEWVYDKLFFERQQLHGTITESDINYQCIVGTPKNQALKTIGLGIKWYYIMSFEQREFFKMVYVDHYQTLEKNLSKDELRTFVNNSYSKFKKIYQEKSNQDSILNNLPLFPGVATEDIVNEFLEMILE